MGGWPIPSTQDTLLGRFCSSESLEGRNWLPKEGAAGTGAQVAVPCEGGEQAEVLIGTEGRRGIAGVLGSSSTVPKSGNAKC